MDSGQPEGNKLHVQGASWIPATPMKPILPKPPLQPLIYARMDRSQPRQYWLGSERLSSNFTNEAHPSSGVACYGGPNASYNWEPAQVRQLQAKHSIDILEGVPFLQLMALADAASIAGSDAALPGNATDLFDSGSSSMKTCIPQPTGCEISDHCQQVCDLNFPSGTESDAAAIRITSQFAPPTPDMGKSKYTEREAAVQQIPTENNRDEREQNENCNTSITIDGENLRENKQLLEPAVHTTITATCTPDGKEGQNAENLDKTPPPRQRRRKHRPKVIIEGKTKRTKPNLKTPSSNPSMRKRVRKSGLSKPSATTPIEITSETSDQEMLKNRRKSCRRAINFYSQAQTRDLSFNSGPLEQDSLTQNIQSTAEVEEVRLEEVGSSTYPNWSMNPMLKSYESLPEKQAPSAEISNNQMENNTKQNGKVISSSEKGNMVETMLNDDNRSLPGNSNGLIFCKNSDLTAREQASCSPRKRSQAIKQTDTGSMNLTGVHYNTLSAYQSMSWMHFPHIHKKKRTEKGQNPISSTPFTRATASAHFMSPESACSFNGPQRNHMVSKSNSWMAGPQLNTCKSKTAAVHGGKEVAVHGGNDLLDKLQTYGSIMAGQTERTKKRPRTTKRLRALAPPAIIGDCEKQPIYPTNQPPVDSSSKNINPSQTCINALSETMQATVSKKKRTKKNFPTNSALLNINKDLQDRRFASFNHYQFFPKTLGTASEHVYQMCCIDAIVEQLKNLDINKESNGFKYRDRALVPYKMQHQEHSAIVVYGRDGTIVTFNPTKKRRPRPKVELDEETGRVWKLLMGNINSEGIDGTDEEKIKWWEEERKVFRGRADSFIARMHLVQGDRRFSQWKGSVVDSVVGVFLTQNVSDHLSSSAYMSLAARFPPKPNGHEASCYQEPIIELDEPEAYMLNLEDDMKLNKQIMQQQEEGSLIKNEMEKSEGRIIVDNNESSGSNVEDGSSNKEPEKKSFSSSHNILEVCSNSVGEISLSGTSPTQACLSGERETYDSFSSQDCLDSSISQTSESIELSLEGNSKDLPSWSKEAHIDSSSEELIQMAGFNTLNAHVTIDTPVVQSENTNNNKLGGKKCANGIDDTFQPDDHEIAIKGSVDHLNCYQMQQNQASETLEVDCYQACNGVQTSINCHNKDGDFHSEQSTLTVESDNHANVEIELIVDIHEAPLSSSELSINAKEPSLTLQSQGSVIEDPQNVESPAECTNNVHKILPNLSPNATGIATQSNPKGYDQSLSNEFKEMKPATSRSQRKQAAKEKEGNVNWDHLRKQTEANGKTRQKTENTMDSLDWEAIRCADVNEIAQAIRERGMNNMLAERIKDFLNRLVKDHGSIDLEWLRDVAPDQAKEYLLSIRGLGLKSVECVRLLTLHHLAFPVDTNVGRIAVRLGWVPLQPLPESLQLHLLELYPVLESIQKYLWPRLCKLDQRTLYELHYQMITFGKVFCTKSKPNCNACPMRGECRHFASAFASARLGLPAPEDKRVLLVSTTECREPDDNQARTIDQPMLSLPPPSTISSDEIKPSESHQSVEKTTIGTCVPIIEEPATPEQESTIQDAIADIEDAFYEDPDEIPTIKLNIEEFSQNLQNYVQNNMELQEGDMSKALIALTPEAASIPMPKLKNISRLRTEHQVYELPDNHPLLEKLKLDRREPDDPSSYLLAIWTPGETASSIQLPENQCSNQECHQLCHEKKCFSCNGVREANSHMVRGTLLIPCRTAMRGSFPLNGTYFQVNEVFADHESSLNPIDVPRDWIWNLPRRTVYFGTSIPTIFKGLSTQGIQHCFWRGFVCVRGFDKKSRAPRPLMARLHFPASKLNRGRGKTQDQ